MKTKDSLRWYSYVVPISWFILSLATITYNQISLSACCLMLAYYTLRCGVLAAKCEFTERALNDLRVKYLDLRSKDIFRLD